MRMFGPTLEHDGVEGSLRLTVGPVEQSDEAWRFGAWSGAFVAAHVFA